MQLISNAFREGQAIPKEYTCDGQNISPEVTWKGTPQGTKSFVLMMDDPDAPAGVWDHWLLFNIPANVNSLKADISELPTGTLGGKNSWGNQTYGGPCPPDKTHRYFFKIYALDTLLNLSAGASKNEILKAIKGHVLAEGSLMGIYKRQH